MQIQQMVCNHLWMSLLTTMIHMTQRQQTGGMQICMHEHMYVVHDTCCFEQSCALFHHKLTPTRVLSYLLFESKVEVFYMLFFKPDCMQAQPEAASSPCWQLVMRQAHQPGESDEGAWR